MSVTTEKATNLHHLALAACQVYPFQPGVSDLTSESTVWLAAPHSQRAIFKLQYLKSIQSAAMDVQMSIRSSRCASGAGRYRLSIAIGPLFHVLSQLSQSVPTFAHVFFLPCERITCV
ncbi:hypothetical protein K449DRAFT_102245 [Hypoxylon sp. EC38]|nr:hypothetical protein K449DRAFT_102245 [Hypoxylon sp. EC38]